MEKEEKKDGKRRRERIVGVNATMDAAKSMTLEGEEGEEERRRK